MAAMRIVEVISNRRNKKKLNICLTEVNQSNNIISSRPVKIKSKAIPVTGLGGL
jgi:hypothetical protein